MKVTLYPSWVYPFGRHVLLPILARLYRASFSGTNIFADLKPPYVIVGNHSTYFDGFWLAGGVPHRVSIVMTDSALHGFLGWLMRRASVIPMSKSKFSVLSISHMVETITRGGVVGIFPEGQTTWDGVSNSVMPGSGKLLKRLGVPIVAATIRGGYHIQPKWSRAKRDGAISVSYRLVANEAWVRSANAAEIEARVQESITHDDVAYMQSEGLEFPSTGGAEYLERVLYFCPECTTFARLTSAGNDLTCAACGASWVWVGDGRLRRGNETDDRVVGAETTVRTWMETQKAALGQAMGEWGADPAEPLFPPDDVVMLTGYRAARRKKAGRGRLTATPEAIVFEPSAGQKRVFLLEAIASCVVITEQNFEFYFDGKLYVFTFVEPGASGLKYLNVVQAVNPEGAESIG